MKYPTGRKFDIKNADMLIEICGCYPGGQGRMVRWMQNSYQITLNGVPMEITEESLDTLFAAMRSDEQKAIETKAVAVEYKAEEPEQPKPQETKPEAPRRGRPRKA